MTLLIGTLVNATLVLAGRYTTRVLAWTICVALAVIAFFQGHILGPVVPVIALGNGMYVELTRTGSKGSACSWGHLWARPWCWPSAWWVPAAAPAALGRRHQNPVHFPASPAGHRHPGAAAGPGGGEKDSWSPNPESPPKIHSQEEKKKVTAILYEM